MKTSKFQIIVLIVFIAFIIAGVAFFATYKGGGQSNQLPSITIWGTFPKAEFDQYLAKVNSTLSQQMSVKYVEESQASFLGDFVAALARGNGPDAILVSADILLPTEDKLVSIPYTSYPQRSFIDGFVDEAQVYLGANGILGIPFSIDPMVMYWNRDTFNAAGIAVPPKYWDEFKDLNKKLTVKGDNGTVIKSAIAMGDFSNVVNARELLGSLILQSGNPVTAPDSYGVLGSAIGPNAAKSAVPAVTFFTQFVDPSNDNYSWNHSWTDSKTAFVSGKLATYFGFTSELSNIRNKNPNLNFDIAPLPQLRTGGIAATFGRIYAFSIVKQSQVQSAAFQIIYTLTQPQYLANISSDMYLPSVSRSVIAAGSKDPYITIFNSAALIAKGWLDADPSQSGAILGSMVQNITTGQKSIFQAVSDASSQYDAILHQAAGQ